MLNLSTILYILVYYCYTEIYLHKLLNSTYFIYDYHYKLINLISANWTSFMPTKKPVVYTVTMK